VLQSDLVRMVDDPMSRQAYEQLMNLETEIRETGIIYKFLPGQHDDLGTSCAILTWAARHRHLSAWSDYGLAPAGRACTRVKNWVGAPLCDDRPVAER
jgi:hypothetical protein